jgi:hypothetical protein
MARDVSQSFTTPFFRLSFPNLAEPRKKTNAQTGKVTDTFDMVMLFPTTAGHWGPPADLTQLIHAAKDTRDKHWNNPAARPPVINMPFKDGSQPNKAGKIHEGFAGCIVSSAMSTRRPGMVGPDPKVALDPKRDLYPGCWCRAVVHCFTYENGGNYGVSFGLDHIQKWKDDSPLGGSAGNPEDHFQQLDAPAPQNGGAFGTGPNGPTTQAAPGTPPLPPTPAMPTPPAPPVKKNVWD